MNTIAKMRRIILTVGLCLTVLLSGYSFLSKNLVQAAASTAVSAKASHIIATGETFMGVRYQWGAKAGRTDVFDCSSFVQYVYKQNGIQLPRSSKEQSVVGTFVARNQLEPGDLVFFYSPIHHVAIYIGNGQILHTYGNPQGVTISKLNTGWWNAHYETARRVLPHHSPSNVQPSPATSPSPVATPSPVVSTYPGFQNSDNFQNFYNNIFWRNWL